MGKTESLENNLAKSNFKGIKIGQCLHSKPFICNYNNAQTSSEYTYMCQWNILLGQVQTQNAYMQLIMLYFLLINSCKQHWKHNLKVLMDSSLANVL